jgi:hypothetical protein
MGRQSKQGKMNMGQTREQIEKHDIHNDIEAAAEFTVGNTNAQSQKKSGVQVNKAKKQ